MVSNQLPSVLFDSRGSISMERALKQIKELLELIPESGIIGEDRISASLEDIDTMLNHIDRS